MILIGLTGIIGSGKTFALNFFKSKKITVFSADDEVKKILESKIVKDKIYKKPSEKTADAVNTSSDPIADETIQMFCKIFGSVAGSMALTVGALGGVYITSDLVRNFLDLFIKSEFQQSFENKGRLQPVLADIPVYLSKKKNMGLIGTAYQINNFWIQKGFKV